MRQLAVQERVKSGSSSCDSDDGPTRAFTSACSQRELKKFLGERPVEELGGAISHGR